MGTSCTQLHMFYVADKSRESETGAYYSLYAFVCHFIFQSATNNTISSNILQYIAICNISIFSIGHIVLYCSSEYCNIAIFQYIVSPLVYTTYLKHSGVASLDLMLGHTFYDRPCLASYWNPGSYVHLYMAVVQKVHSMTNYF